MKRGYILLLVGLTIGSCSQWNVVDLRSRQYAFIGNGEGEGKVMLRTDDYGMQGLTMNLTVVNDRICVADNVLKRIQVMDNDGDVELIVGAIDKIDTKRVHGVNFKFDFIGAITMDDEGNLFVQNRLSQGRGDAGSDELDLSPSYILAFNKHGDLQYTLGQKGAPDLPFYQIESLDVDREGRLFVVSRQVEGWSVFRFAGKKRDFHANLGALRFVEKDGDDEYRGKVETVKLMDNSERFILSVAYYQDLRLIYRKVFDYNIERNELGKGLMNIPDPRNVLFSVVNDRLVCFWNIEGSDIRLMYCNMEGTVMKNVQLAIDMKNPLYTKLISNRSGGLYSYSITKRGVQILQWE
ncbi:MAG: hypothetical protein JXA20_18930 [Spirochaetes bacterium]|nr:hypothetical protein [Spirochaetota bacterium]